MGLEIVIIAGSILMLLPFVVAAQKNYTISGTISGLKEPAKVYLATVQGGGFKDVDSAQVKNGKFKLT